VHSLHPGARAGGAEVTSQDADAGAGRSGSVHADPLAGVRAIDAVPGRSRPLVVAADRGRAHAGRGRVDQPVDREDRGSGRGIRDLELAAVEAFVTWSCDPVVVPVSRVVASNGVAGPRLHT